MDGEELTEQETALYDRQIRVWGADAQRRYNLNCYFPLFHVTILVELFNLICLAIDKLIELMNSTSSLWVFAELNLFEFTFITYLNVFELSELVILVET